MDGLSPAKQQSHAFFQLVPSSVTHVRAPPVLAVPSPRHVRHEPKLAHAQPVRPIPRPGFALAATRHAVAHADDESDERRAGADDGAIPAQAVELCRESACHACERLRPGSPGFVADVGRKAAGIQGCEGSIGSEADNDGVESGPKGGSDGAGQIPQRESVGQVKMKLMCSP